jgi:hypothetical protein
MGYATITTHLILFLFSLVILLFRQHVFGVTMVFLATPFSSTNQQNKLFQMVTLYFAAFFNNVALMDNTTYCMNAIYSILLYLSILLLGSLFFYSLDYDDTEDDTSFKSYVMLFVVIVFDVVYYSLGYSNEWFLFVVFVSYLDMDDGNSYQKVNAIKVFFYLLGLIVNGFNLPLGQWISYSVFISVMFLIGHFM